MASPDPDRVRDWVQAAPLAELRRAGKLLVRRGGRQVALFDTPHGPRACRNQCPHEGYPLVEGTLDRECVLTCNWHNWKFHLDDGSNLYGGDRLRVYPTEVRDGEVWVDLADPPLHAQRAEALENLERAFDDHEYDRIARELERFRLTGADPLEAVAVALRWSHDRLEFGWTHAYAGLAEWLQLRDQRAGDDEARLVCLLEAVGHMAWDVLREDRYPYPAGAEDWDEPAFLAAVHAEDEPRAVALMRGALAQGPGFAGVEGALTRAALAHYQSFGHSLIYVSKVGRIIEALGPSAVEPLLVSLVREMVYARREDLIPEFRAYRGSLDRWADAAPGPAPAAHDYWKLGVEKALALTAAAAGADPRALYRALLGANARNLLGFDLAWQRHVHRPVQDNVGWLDFTHGITFAGAVRVQCSRFPDVWPAGLLQMACFSGRNAHYTLEAPPLDDWRVADPEVFLGECLDGVLDHGRDEYIESVHLLKTVTAARDEYLADPDGPQTAPLLAGLNRFLHSPIKRKHTRRTALQAMKFVGHEA